MEKAAQDVPPFHIMIEDADFRKEIYHETLFTPGRLR